MDKRNPNLKDWQPVCRTIFKSDETKYALCMKMAEDLENNKIPQIEFMASMSTLSGKSLDELEKILDDAVHGVAELELQHVFQEPGQSQMSDHEYKPGDVVVGRKRHGLWTLVRMVSEEEAGYQTGLDIPLWEVQPVGQGAWSRTLVRQDTFEPATKSQMSASPDLRTDFDEKFAVFGGTLYRKGNIVQMWWDDTDKETWTAPNEQQAKDNFISMKERWNDKSELMAFPKDEGQKMKVTIAKTYKPKCSVCLKPIYVGQEYVETSGSRTRPSGVAHAYHYHLGTQTEADVLAKEKVMTEQR